MFMILITAAFFIFNAFEGFTIWIPILAVVLPLLLFIGGDPRIPVLLDGDVPLDKNPIAVSASFFLLHFCLQFLPNFLLNLLIVGTRI